MKNKFKVDNSNRVVDDAGIHVCETFGNSYDPDDIADALNFQEDRSKLSELDQLAVDYYASGRTLKIQCRVANAWDDESDPTFDPSYEWRRKPTMQSISVDVLRMPSGSLVASVNGHGKAAAHWVYLGTLTGEVEV